MSTIVFTRSALPNAQFKGSIDDLLNLFIDHLIGSLEEGAFSGQIGGLEPTSDIGLWLNNNVWYGWDSTIGKYLPIPVVTGRLFGGVRRTTFLQSGASSGNVTLTLPDEDGGTLATVSDLSGARAIETAGGTIVFIDGNHPRIYIVLSGNLVSLAAINLRDGQTGHIWIEQPPSSSFTVTWNSAIKWPGGVAPTQSTSGAGERKIDHYWVTRVGDQLFGDAEQGFLVATSFDVTAPTIGTFFGSGAQITLGASEPLKGNSAVSTSLFVVKVNGVNQTINSVSVNSRTITISLASPFLPTDTVQVQYLGGANAIEDWAGNDLAAFGLHAVSNGTGTGFSGGLTP